MTKVKNQKVINKISKKSLRARKNKNIIAVLAIALTAVLFTVIFSVGGNLLKSNTESTMRQVGGRTHAGFKSFTWAEYEQLKKDTKIRDLSYNVLIGMTANQELNKIQGEVRYFEPESAKDVFSYPTTGTMPKKRDDIAMSTIVLDALGIPHNIGERIELKMMIHNQEVNAAFVLSGFWEGDKAAHAQEILVSREYMETECPIETVPVYEAENTGDYSGYMDVNFNFRSSWDIEGQVKKLCERAGFDTTKVSYGVNWAYGFSSLDTDSVLLLVVVLACIMLSGYLIIYNVFYLNIYSDIQFYGLLKTVGTTGRQLKKIVRRQALRLCLYGIPAGLLIGWGVGQYLTPAVMSMMTDDTVSYSVNPWIFVGAAVFSVLTVHISCIRPCHMAAKVSPIEAVKYMEKQKKAGKKRTKKATPFHMAMANVRRFPKKLILVVLSLGLSLTMLNSVYTIVTGFDMDKFLANYMVSDYTVADASMGNFSSMNINLAGVTKEFQQELAGQSGVKNVGNIYIRGIEHKLSELEWERMENYIEKNPEEMGDVQIKEELDRIASTKTFNTDVYGVNKEAAEKIAVPGKKIDWEMFNTGKYVIVSSFYPYGENTDNYPYLKPGETVTLEITPGVSKTYEVLEIGWLPYALCSQRFGVIQTSFLLPESEFMAQCGETQPMRTIFDAEKGKEASVTAWLKNYCENVNTDLLGQTKSDYVAQFDNLKRVYGLVGGLLSLILGMIGILNFINVTITSILSRKRELAMMEAIGMSPGQQKRMLQFEGMGYALLALAVTCTIGMALGYVITQLVAGGIPIFTWHFTMLPVVLCIPFLLLISVVLPAISYKRACRSTVVERLRVEE